MPVLKSHLDISDNSQQHLEKVSQEAKKHHRNTSVQLRAGIAFQQAGDSNRAEHYFNTVLELQPSNHKAIQELAKVYLTKALASKKIITTLEEESQGGSLRLDQIQTIIELCGDMHCFCSNTIECDQENMQAWRLRTWCLVHEAQYTRMMEQHLQKKERSEKLEIKGL